MIESNYLIRICGIKEINNLKIKSLTFLYRELIGSSSINLYLSLLYFNHNTYFSLRELLDLLNINIINFEKMLHNLEKLSLLKTYTKDNEYLIEVKEALNPLEFFNNILYDRLLANKLEKRYHEIKRLLIEEEVDIKGYQDISHKLDTNWSKENEKRYIDIKKIKDEHLFPIEHFIKSLSTNLFPEVLRTFDNLLLISKLADNFAINEDNMRKYLHQSIIYTPDVFLDKDKLKKLCSNNKTDQSGDGYHMPNINFLKKIQGGNEPSYNDRMLIYNLANDQSYNLSTELINFLLEYSLKECNNELRPSFIYTVASNWRRNNIDTIEKAKERIQDRKNYINKKEDIISEFDTSINPTLSDEDIKKYLG